MHLGKLRIGIGVTDLPDRVCRDVDPTVDL